MPSLAPMVERVSPAVVNIAAQRQPQEQQAQRGQAVPPGMEGSPFEEFFRRFFGEGAPVPSPKGRPMTPLGSGFIVDPEGYVVTNNHVVGDADQILVTLSDGSQFDAKLVGRDPATDLALLKLEANKTLPSVDWGRSSKVRAGDWVLAVGSPFGLGGTVTAGIVSAMGRDLQTGPFDDFLQIDAPINRGNSGGPTFNMSGKVIGVNTAIFSPTGGNIGIGFAVPSDLAQTVVADLKDDGEVSRGWLGVRVQAVTPEIGESMGMEKPKGALVAGVGDETPAKKAGIQEGDVIVEYRGDAVEEMRDLPRLVAGSDPGETVEVGVLRDGERLDIEVTLGDMAERTAASLERNGSPKVAELEDYGMAVGDLTPKLRRKLELSENATGPAVVALDPTGVAARAGMRPADVILSVAGQEVETTKGFVDALEAAVGGPRSAVLIQVARGGTRQFVGLPDPQA